ncbi:BON domain-containing protein [Streptomyces sp. NPDC048415]|jgi:hypothetical protein|uniref:BON domain-containing protein n=1 Tax=Streptomyces sp. NPDC048415 TaxID=3154822 RepID=UPI00343812E9
MNEHGAEHAADARQNPEYRVAHLRDRLAAGELGELGIKIEVRGGGVLLTGTVPSPPCREEVLRAVHQELAGLAVHCDIAVAENDSPDHAEELT